MFLGRINKFFANKIKMITTFKNTKAKCKYRFLNLGKIAIK